MTIDNKAACLADRFIVKEAVRNTVTAMQEKRSAPNPYATALLGSALGAGTGGLLGYLSSDDARKDKRRAIAGALLGGMVGGGLGHSYGKYRSSLGASESGTPESGVPVQLYRAQQKPVDVPPKSSVTPVVSGDKHVAPKVVDDAPLRPYGGPLPKGPEPVSTIDILPDMLLEADPWIHGIAPTVYAASKLTGGADLTPEMRATRVVKNLMSDNPKKVNAARAELASALSQAGTGGKGSKGFGAKVPGSVADAEAALHNALKDIMNSDGGKPTGTPTRSTSMGAAATPSPLSGQVRFDPATGKVTASPVTAASLARGLARLLMDVPTSTAALTPAELNRLANQTTFYSRPYTAGHRVLGKHVMDLLSEAPKAVPAKGVGAAAAAAPRGSTLSRMSNTATKKAIIVQALLQLLSTAKARGSLLEDEQARRAIAHALDMAKFNQN